MSLTEVAPLLGVSKSTLYAAARAGTLPFPVIRIQTRYVIPTKPLFEALGLDHEAPKDAA